MSEVFMVEDHELPIALNLVLRCVPPEPPEPEANLFLSVEASLDGENWPPIGEAAGFGFPGVSMTFVPESPAHKYRAVVENTGGNIEFLEGVVTLMARNASSGNGSTTAVGRGGGCCGGCRST